MSKVYSDSTVIHLAIIPVGFFVSSNPFKAEWSVIIVKGCPNKYGLKSLIDHITAKHSNLVAA